VGKVGADVAELTSGARVVALERRWPEDIACHNGGDLLDVVFGWPDFTRLRRMVESHCAAAGLSGSRLDDFVLAVHEIAANAIVHAGTGGRLILRRAADGLRCMIADHEDPGPAGRIPRAREGYLRPPEAAAGCWDLRRDEDSADPDMPHEPVGTETGRGLWLAAQLADELSITTGPDSTVVSLYVQFG
jgi:anti-sigma regulatory factor (Ser/Thr protein kinase)